MKDGPGEGSGYLITAGLAGKCALNIYKMAFINIFTLLALGSARKLSGELESVTQP